MYVPMWPTPQGSRPIVYIPIYAAEKDNGCIEGWNGISREEQW